MSDETIIVSPIQRPHVIIFDLLMKQRLDEIGLDALLVYMIDTVDESALYWLASQFDVLGFGGWKLADTTEKKRSLIKKAIELHRYKGTVWAIREALKTVGFPDATITEHVNGHWARFTIQLNVGEVAVNAQQIDDAVTMVKHYKNVRSWLDGITFEITVNEGILLDDDSFESPADVLGDDLFTGGDFLYNGEHLYDGSKNYSSDSDLLELTIN